MELNFNNFPRARKVFPGVASCWHYGNAGSPGKQGKIDSRLCLAYAPRSLFQMKAAKKPKRYPLTAVMTISTAAAAGSKGLIT